MAGTMLKRIWIIAVAVLTWNLALSQATPEDEVATEKDEFSEIVRYKVGNMIRVDYLSPSAELVGEAIYRTEDKEIHLYFSKAKNTGSVTGAINMLKSRLTLPASNRISSQLLSNNSVHIQLKQQPGKVISWHKGVYCFVADGRLSNKPDLEQFLRFFTD